MRFASFSLLLAISLSAQSPEAPSAPKEPEFINQFFTLDDKGDLHKLVTENWTNVERKTGNLLSAETTIFSTFQGEHSPLRFTKGDLVFVVRVQSREYDPKTWVHFLSLDVTKGHRERAAVQKTRKGNILLYEKEGIPVNVERYGMHSWKITPMTPLPPGEYTMSTLYARESWTFGIDESK